MDSFSETVTHAPGLTVTHVPGPHRRRSAFEGRGRPYPVQPQKSLRSPRSLRLGGELSLSSALLSEIAPNCWPEFGVLVTDGRRHKPVTRLAQKEPLLMKATRV